MARIKMGLNFKGWEELLVKLDEIGNGQIVRDTVEKALNVSKENTTNRLRELVAKPNLPHQGKYSHGRTVRSLDTDSRVEWEGTIATIPAGFKFSESGLVPIMLMKGTPRMSKVKGLEDELYGRKGIKARGEEQSAIIKNAIDEIMRGS